MSGTYVLLDLTAAAGAHQPRMPEVSDARTVSAIGSPGVTFTASIGDPEVRFTTTGDDGGTPTPRRQSNLSGPETAAEELLRQRGAASASSRDKQIPPLAPVAVAFNPRASEATSSQADNDGADGQSPDPAADVDWEAIQQGQAILERKRQEAVNALRNVDWEHIPPRRVQELLNDQQGKPEDERTARAFSGGGKEAVVITVENADGEAQNLVLEKVWETRKEYLINGSVEVRTGRYWYRVAGSAPGTYDEESSADVIVLDAARMGRAQSAEAALNFLLHALPAGAAADEFFNEGDFREGLISAVADVALTLTAVGKVAGISGRAAVILNRSATVLEGGVGVYRAGEAAALVLDGDTASAAGAAGEALLRLAGVTFSTSELRALKKAQREIQKVKASRGVNVPKTRIEIGGSHATVEIVEGVGKVRVSFVETMDDAFFRAIQTQLKENQATSMIVEFQASNTDLAIDIGRRMQQGRTLLGGRIEIARPGKSPVFRIIFDSLPE